MFKTSSSNNQIQLICSALCVLLEYIMYIVRFRIFGSLHVNFRLHIFGHNFCHFSYFKFKTVGLAAVLSKLCYAPYIVCVECLASES